MSRKTPGGINKRLTSKPKPKLGEFPSLLKHLADTCTEAKFKKEKLLQKKRREIEAQREEEAHEMRRKERR